MRTDNFTVMLLIITRVKVRAASSNQTVKMIHNLQRFDNI